MSELLTYIALGMRHILDIEAMDHILFLVALAAIYRPRDIRDVLWVITAFTVRHSLTLALAVTGAVHLPSAVIEFLIPITIVATGIENLLIGLRRRSELALPNGWRRPMLASVFGLVHGAGFANYLRDLFVDHIAIPLFGFNVGIEIGQLVVLAIAGTALFSIDRFIDAIRIASERWPALRIRMFAVSLLVMLVASRWAIERAPW